MLWLASLLPQLAAMPQTAGPDTAAYITVQGKVRDETTRKPLQFVLIAVKELNLSTVTNAEGYFILKIPGHAREWMVDMSHVGYRNQRIGVAALLQDKLQTIDLRPIAYHLKDVAVLPSNPEEILRMAMAHIPQNYGESPVAMTAFYREFVKRNSRYISIAEAVVDIYKASYTALQRDMARIFKGRKSADVDRVDTVMFKYQGGISSSLWLDVMKNKDVGLFSGDFFNDHLFALGEMEMIDDKPHYVINFDQKPHVRDFLYRGKIYIEPNSLAVARVDFNMNVENHPEAGRLFLKHAPRGVKIRMENAQYLINYREKNGRWYYSYGKIEIKFKTNWKKFLFFKPTGTIISEMAVTDMNDTDVAAFPRKEAVRENDIISDKLSVFSGDSFWENYNYIEPEQPIEQAIKKMNKKLLRDGMLKDTEQEKENK
jgi:hypothetical protein